MKLSWNSLKISIAGAKLSHLVQKDKIWDHGTMTEQVKNIFYVVEKAKYKRDAESVKKYVTANAISQIDELIKRSDSCKPMLKNTVLTHVSIIEVNLKTGSKPDRFTALISGKRKAEENQNRQTFSVNNQDPGIESFSERWYFIRQGEWWLLDEIKTKHLIL